MTVPQPKPMRRKRRQGRGSAGHRLTTSNLADSFIRLCHDPCKDLKRWIDEDKKQPCFVSTALFSISEAHHESTARTTSAVEDPRRLCEGSLRQVQGRMDADGIAGRVADDLSSRSRTSSLGDDELRSLRTEGRGNLADEQPDMAGAIAGEFAIVAANFASRIAAARATMTPAEAAAIIRRLRDEQTAAMRAITDRMQAARRARSEAFPHTVAQLSRSTHPP
jgi:hypothetical protein